MVHLAGHAESPQTAQQVSEATCVPSAYMSKVLQSLARARLIRSQRGLHGGFRLPKAPSEITIYEVVQAVEPLCRITECPLDIPSHGATLCPLHRRLDEAIATVEAAFQSTTLGELLVEEGSVRPLCPLPSGAEPVSR
jgi:Rrf2 family protein